ncbi:hypothetical protein YM304_02210 [Ilumatobacter coccineus YM16-304]|uniref:Uncharacterized protein n=2 Tax=Ilumatobacter coccineus TaxID=467094 RepID=A0A6C7E5M2_ILUCY|nr:hypothetical protein YM304_02210 [Ilumatobacter coccineus YM16-304]
MAERFEQTPSRQGGIGRAWILASAAVLAALACGKRKNVESSCHICCDCRADTAKCESDAPDLSVAAPTPEGVDTVDVNQLGALGPNTTRTSVHGPSKPLEIQQFMASSAPRILSIRILSSLARLLTRSTRYPLKLVHLAIAAAVLSAIPAILEVSLGGGGGFETIGDRRSGIAFVYFYALTLLCLWSPHYTWNRLTELSASLDTAIPNRADRLDVASWLERHSRPMRYFPLCLIVGVSSTVVSVAWLGPALEPDVPFSIGSHAAIFLVAVFAFENLLWVMRLPRLVWVISRKRLDLYWHNPASTPAIDRLTRLLGSTALLGLLGGASIGLPIVYAWSFLRATSGAAIVWVAPVAMLATFLLTGLLPQYVAYQAVAESRRRALQDLIGQYPDVSLARPPHDRSAIEAARIWALVYDAPSWVFRRETVVQYGAALLATAITLFVTIAIGATT